MFVCVLFVTVTRAVRKNKTFGKIITTSRHYLSKTASFLLYFYMTDIIRFFKEINTHVAMKLEAERIYLT